MQLFKVFHREKMSKIQGPVHTFGGWYKDAECTTAYDFDTEIVNGNITIYAKWIEKGFTVTFNANGHGTAPGAVLVQEGQKVNNPGNLTETGYTFGSWYKDAECTTAYDFATETVTADITLYAKWTANSYTVSFDLVGIGTTPQASVNYGSTVTKPADPENSHATFEGWYKESNYQNEWDFDVDTVSADTVLYARWGSRQHTFEADVCTVCGATKLPGSETIGYIFDSETGLLIVSGTGEIPDYTVETAPFDSIRKDITSIVVEEGITKLGQDVFHGCYETTISLGNTITIIGYGAFKVNVRLEEFVCPPSLTEIGSYAFDNCISLQSITMNEGLETIRIGLFHNTALKQLDIPASVTTLYGLGYYAFDSVTISENNSKYFVEDGAIYTKGDNKYLACVFSNNTDFKIAEDTTRILQYSFSDWKGKEIDIPASVERIGLNTFYYCFSLETITFMGDVPPSFSSNAIIYQSNKVANIYVPNGKVAEYKAQFEATTNNKSYADLVKEVSPEV